MMNREQVLEDILKDMLQTEEDCFTVFVGGDNEIELLDKEEIREKSLGKDTGKKKPNKYLAEKRFEHSNQSESEITGQGNLDIFEKKIAPVPYDPYDLALLLESSPIHYKACDVKARDSVGREYKLLPKYPLKDLESEDKHSRTTSKEEFQKDCALIEDFLEEVNSDKTFQELAYLVAMDRESIGWGAFEVIRRADGKIAKLDRIPAVRLRALEGGDGFVEIDFTRSEDAFEDTMIYRYYQPFGQKVVAKELDPFDFDQTGKTVKVPYNPEKHGELNTLTNQALDWNLRDKNTGKKISTSGTNFTKKAANEIIFFPNDHNNTVYYGYADVVPAIHNVIMNININKYQRDFFKNNCIPKYAVIIKGKKISKEFKKEIADYFDKSLKGENFQTMILALSQGLGASVDVEFRELDSGRKEADFLETLGSNNQEIITAEGVPPALLAVHDSASLGSGKGMAQAELYKDRFVIPSQIFYANRINKMFKLGLGVSSAIIKFDPLDVRDNHQVAQVIQLLLSVGCLSINEARRQLGMDPTIGGDVHFLRLKEKSIVRVNQIQEVTEILNKKLMEPVTGDIQLDDELDNNENLSKQPPTVRPE